MEGNLDSENSKTDKPKIKKKSIIILGIIAGTIISCLVISVIIVAIFNPTSRKKEITTEQDQEEVDTEVKETENVIIETQDLIFTATNTETKESEPAQTRKPTSTLKPTSTREPTATENPYIVRIGTYLVGNDLQPGIYYGEAGDNVWDSCYWARLSDLSGDFGSILANSNAKGQYYVEVKDTDYAFETDCLITKLEGIPESIEFKKDLAAGT